MVRLPATHRPSTKPPHQSGPQNQTAYNVKRAIPLAAQGHLEGDALVTHLFPLEQIAEAFHMNLKRYHQQKRGCIVGTSSCFSLSG